MSPLNSQKLSEELAEMLKDSIGKPNTKNVAEQAGLMVKHFLAKTEAELYGYSNVKTDLLWNTLTIKQKLQWFWRNKIVKSIATSERKRIDKLNELAYQEALNDPENEENDYHYVRYPWWAEPHPKGVVVVEASVKLQQPMEFISLSFTLDKENNK